MRGDGFVRAAAVLLALLFDDIGCNDAVYLLFDDVETNEVVQLFERRYRLLAVGHVFLRRVAGVDATHVPVDAPGLKSLEGLEHIGLGELVARKVLEKQVRILCVPAVLGLLDQCPEISDSGLPAALAFPERNRDYELADLGENVVGVAGVFPVVSENEQALLAVLPEELGEIPAGCDIVGSIVSESLGQIDDDSTAVAVFDDLVDVVVSFKEVGLDLAHVNDTLAAQAVCFIKSIDQELCHIVLSLAAVAGYEVVRHVDVSACFKLVFADVGKLTDEGLVVDIKVGLAGRRNALFHHERQGLLVVKVEIVSPQVRGLGYPHG